MMMIIIMLELLLLRFVQLRPKPRRRRRRWVLIVRSHLVVVFSSRSSSLSSSLSSSSRYGRRKGWSTFFRVLEFRVSVRYFFFEKTLFVSLDLKISYTRCDILIMIEDTFRSNISLY